MDKLPSEVNAVESRVQIDGKCVTSRGPGTAMEYSVVLVEQLYGKEKAEEVAGPMVYGSFSTVYICVRNAYLPAGCRNIMWKNTYCCPIWKFCSA
jgi:hypothetical protein